MDFGSMLNYLQGLLSNKQNMQGQEYTSNLGLQNQILGQQGSEFNASLGEQANEFAGNLALQKQIQDQANALAQQQFGLESQGQTFQEGQQAKTTSFPYLQQLAMLNPAYQTAQANNPVVQKLINGVSPLASTQGQRQTMANASFIPAISSVYGSLIG